MCIRDRYTFPRNGPRDEYNKPRSIPIWSPTYLPLRYPLLYFSGESGWSPGNYRDGRKSKNLSTSGKPVDNFYYSRQRLLIEPAFHVLCSVAQEFAVDQYARHDDLQLSYIQYELPKKRATTKNVIRSNQANNDKVGTRLPASFHGSVVNSKRKQLDAMAVVTRKGPPDLMITFTANPAWPEIVANLLPGQTGMDRPDLVNRVFKIKLRELLKDLKSNVFTKQLYGIYVCGYQARGLVHAHIIVKFEGDGPQRSNEVDKWVWTNLPDESIADGKLREKVIKYMVHKKCGTVNPSAPCMRTARNDTHNHLAASLTSTQRMAAPNTEG